MVSPTHRILLLVILAVGLSLRLAHFWAISQTSYPRIPLVSGDTDMHATLQWAKTILAGDWLGRNTYHPYFFWMRDLAPLDTWYRWWGGQAIFQQAPLYAYWVAAWLVLLGKSLSGILFVQLVLGALDSLVIFLLARRLFDVRVGLLAAAMTALYAPFIFHQGTLLRDWLPPLLEPLALLLIVRARETERARDWLAAGATIGVALLVKESLLLFLPLLLLWLVGQYRRAWPQLMRAGAALVVGIIVLMTPLFVRNAVVGAPLLSISNRAPEGFIEGNAPDAAPLGLVIPKSLPEILDRSNGRMATVVHETLGLYHGDWLRYARQFLIKLRALMDTFEIPNNLAIGYAREISPVLQATLTYGLVFPLGLAGLFLSLIYRRSSGILLLYGAATATGLLLTIVLARYRLVLVPVLIIYAAVALITLVDAIRGRHWGSAAVSLALILAAALLQHGILPVPELRTASDLVLHPSDHGYSADVYRQERRYDRAVAEMIKLRERAGRTPDLARESRSVIEQSWILEGDDRIRWANQLHQDGHRDAALEQASYARAAYFEYFLMYRQAASDLALPFLRLNPSQQRAFFAQLLLIRPEGPERQIIRTLLTWLP